MENIPISAKDLKKVEEIVKSNTELRGYEIFIPGLFVKIKELQNEIKHFKEEKERKWEPGYW